MERFPASICTMAVRGTPRASAAASCVMPRSSRACFSRFPRVARSMGTMLSFRFYWTALSQSERTTHCCHYHPIVFLIEHQCHYLTNVFDALVNWSWAEIECADVG